MQTSWVDLLHRGWTFSSLLLSLESGVDCPCPWFNANSLCCPATNSLSAPFSSQLSFASPYHFRIRRDFRSKNPLSGFAPKQTKESSALAGNPYSATFYLTHRKDHIRCYRFRPEWGWVRWQRTGTPHSPKFQLYWNLTIRLYSVISRTLIGRFLLLCRGAVSVFYSPSRLGHRDRIPFKTRIVLLCYNKCFSLNMVQGHRNPTS